MWKTNPQIFELTSRIEIKLNCGKKYLIAPPPTNKLSGEQIVLVFCSDVCIIITIKLQLTFTKKKTFIFRDNIFISATKNHPIMIQDLFFKSFGAKTKGS